MQQNFQPNIQSNIPNNNIPSPSTGVPPQWALDIFSRLDGISRRLEKLDSIQSSISAIQREVKTLSSRVGEVEKSQEFLSKTVEENKQKTEGNSCVMSRLKLELEESIKLNAQMKEEILDLQCRSMRDNLLFYNIKEAQNKETEDCVRIIQDICSSELEIMEDVSIERAHRIGKRESGKIRPIVVKFTRFPQRELVRKSAYKLKNTDLSISEQFPREIQDRRKQLLPVLKQAKANNRKTVFVKDKLFIDGRLYRQDQGTTPLPNRKGSQSRWGGPENENTLKIIGWNINGGFENKWGQLKHYLCTYDIICLSECWIRKDFSVDVEGYKTHIFHRDSRSVQGGGTIILIKDIYDKYVSVIDSL